MTRGAGSRKACDDLDRNFAKSLDTSVRGRPEVAEVAKWWHGKELFSDRVTGIGRVVCV